MPHSRASLTQPVRRLPHLALAPVQGGQPVPIIWRRTAPILLFLHARECPICREYAARVSAAAAAISDWDGRPLIILGEGADASMHDLVGTALPVLEDAGNRLADALTLVAPTVIIADQW